MQQQQSRELSNMVGENKNIPELRFQGFSGAWEKRKLGDLGKTFTGLSGKTKEDFGHGDARFVTYMNVYLNPIASEKGLERVELDSKQHLVQYGDVFFTTSSETPEEVGMSSVWTFKLPNIYLNSFTFGYRPTYHFDLNYLAFMLRTEIVRKDIKLLAQGVSRFNISKTKMMDIQVPIPEKDEQIKIGTFLKTLDNLIAVNQRKLNTLKKLKKSYLQKMFPQNGSEFPELRFAGFTTPWEKRKLGDLAGQTYGGGTPKTNVNRYWEGNIPWIQSSNLNNDDVQNIKINKFISDDAIQDSAVKLVPADSIAIVTRVGVGKLALVHQSFATSQDFLSLSHLNADTQFSLYAIYKMMKKEASQTQGTSIKGITKNVLTNKILLVPHNLAEQAKVGSFFKSLDNRITVNQRKLDALKKLKQGYLQKMFC
ncbi:MAG: restriction endonuclease subunit S [Oenococcus sp.]|uniref:restriction endonuclease subunit S n=1 Tax=Oenococcus sp. TaxID=1979414 RepID=UPI0039EB5F92